MIAQIFLIRWFAPLVFDAVLIYGLARFLSAVRENQTLNAFDAPEESGAFVIFCTGIHTRMSSTLFTHLTKLFRIAALPLVVLALSAQANADLVNGIWTPNGLAAGDQYRLVFVTSGLFQGTDQFPIYNSRVNTAAEYGSLTGDTFTSPLSWMAMVNTSGQAADMRFRLSTSDFLSGWDGSDVPIYLLGTDDTVAAGWDQLFTAGGWDRGIDRNENGGFEIGQGVWTGSLDNGDKAPFPNALGNSNPNGSLTSEKDFFAFTGTNSDANHLFAISNVATVAAASVPEPSSLFLGLAVAPVLVFVRRRPNRQSKAITA